MDILVFWKVHKNGDRAGVRKASAGFGDTNRSRTIPTGNLGGTDDCVCLAAGPDQKQHVPRLECRSTHLQDIAVTGRERRDAEAKKPVRRFLRDVRRSAADAGKQQMSGPQQGRLGAVQHLIIYLAAHHICRSGDSAKYLVDCGIAVGRFELGVR